VRGVVLATQAALGLIGDGGRIITIGSCLGDRVAFPGLAVYSMSKSALVSFNKGLAREIGPRGITANLVQPGPIDTDMNPADGDFADTMRAQTALGRYGRPEDIAGMVAWLAGPESGFVTGTEITVDGGTNA
jgi:3-oxoacyl-[acyl-carrier protein] reductase